MATLDFPSSPQTGDLYPQPQVPGQPVYTWDGVKWTTYTLPIGGGMGLSSAPPLMDGAVTPGTMGTASRGDHVHPSDTSRIAKIGDAMTGPLVLAADPTANLGAATKQYADGVAGTAVSGKVSKAGDTMTGLLLLSADPAANLGAATKQYADGVAVAKVSRGGDTMTGPLILSVDPSAAFGAATKQYVDGKDSLRVAKAGDSMTGPLILSADPSALMGAATKQYVDAHAGTGGGGGASLTISDTPPASPADGSLWWESDSGTLFVRYNDGSSSQWVTAAPQPDLNALGMVRYDTAQSLLSAQQLQARQNIYAAPFDAMAYSGMQINGGMEVSQENGTTALVIPNTSKYIVDGWQAVSSGPQSVGMVQNTTAPPGYTKSLQIYVGSVANPSPAAGEYLTFHQPIEGLRIARLAFGTANASPITLGFWIRSFARPGIFPGSIRNGAANRSCTFNVTINAANTWEYKTVTIPGDTGGTWVTDNTNGLYVSFAPLVGNTLALAPGVWTAGNFLGTPGATNFLQTTTDIIYLTGLVVLPGTQAPTAAQSPLIMRPYDQELLTCQRYFENISGVDLHGYQIPGWDVVTAYPFKVSKRATPTISNWAWGAGASSGPPVAGTVTTEGITIHITNAVGGISQIYLNNITARCDARLQ